MKKTVLAVIEGVDSSGKATQSKLLKEKLKMRYENVECVEFPNYTSPSSAVVKMYLNGDFGTKADDVSPYAASAFFAVDRVASVFGQWHNVFFDNNIVIADRYTTSNMIHQAAKIKDIRDKDAFLDWLYDFEYVKLNLPKPDIVIFLDMPVKYARKLMADRPNKINNSDVLDIHESDEEFLNESYNNAVFVAEKYGWNTVKCVKDGKIRTIDDISDEIYEKICAVIDKK